MIIIGGIGTLSGANLGLVVFRLVQHRWRPLGGVANFPLGFAYILIVLFLPFRIVGTWKAHDANRRTVWNERIARIARSSS